MTGEGKKAKKFVDILTGHYFALPIVVVATLLISFSINEMEPIKAIFVSVSFLIVGALLGWFALLFCRKILEPSFLRNENLELITTRLSSQVINLEIQDNVLIDKALKKIETEAETIWVVSKNLKADIQEPLISWVSENLKNNKEYIWLVPDKGEIRPSIHQLIKCWEKRRVIATKWKFILVSGDSFIHPHDLSIYDMMHDKATRIVEFIFGRKRTVGYELPEELHGDIVTIATRWIDMGNARKFRMIEHANYGKELMNWEK